MNQKAKEFLEKNFPAGSYMQVTILVKNEEFQRFIDVLKANNMTVAVMPHVKAAAEFHDPNNKGTPQ